MSWLLGGAGLSFAALAIAYWWQGRKLKTTQADLARAVRFADELVASRDGFEVALKKAHAGFVESTHRLEKSNAILRDHAAAAYARLDALAEKHPEILAAELDALGMFPSQPSKSGGS